MRKLLSLIVLCFSFSAFADLPVINFARNNEVYVEGETVTINVELDKITDEDVTVNMILESWAPGNISDTDMDTNNLKVFIPRGETRGSVTFTLLEDNTFEYPEMAVVTMTAPVNATLGQYMSLMLQFMDNQDSDTELPTVEFETSVTNATEGTVALVKIKLSAPSGSTIVVPLEICGTAVYGEDHNLYQNKITFYPGSTEATLSISALEDMIPENQPDDLTINIVSPLINVRLGQKSQHIIWINDAIFPVLNLQKF